jgi:hypothetical protein
MTSSNAIVMAGRASHAAYSNATGAISAEAAYVTSAKSTHVTSAKAAAHMASTTASTRLRIGGKKAVGK